MECRQKISRSWSERNQFGEALMLSDKLDIRLQHFCKDSKMFYLKLNRSSLSRMKLERTIRFFALGASYGGLVFHFCDYEGNVAHFARYCAKTKRKIHERVTNERNIC